MINGWHCWRTNLQLRNKLKNIAFLLSEVCESHRWHLFIEYWWMTEKTIRLHLTIYKESNSLFCSSQDVLGCTNICSGISLGHFVDNQVNIIDNCWWLKTGIASWPGHCRSWCTWWRKKIIIKSGDQTRGPWGLETLTWLCM